MRRLIDPIELKRSIVVSNIIGDGNTLEELIDEQPTADVPDTNVGDTISRQATIDALDKRFDSIPMEQTTEILLLRKDLRDLPAAQPKRMRGRWMLDNTDFWMCDQCGKWIDILQGDADMNYCPNCGAQMDGGEQEE